MQALEFLNTLVDDSDPDIELTQIEHALQTAEAIRAAVAALGTGDVLVLAGKGHETGQYMKDEVHPFSDREQAIQAAIALGGRAA